MKPFSHKSNARRAARKMLGAAAQEGVDYTLQAAGGSTGGFRFRAIDKSKPARRQRLKPTAAHIDGPKGRDVTAEVAKLMRREPPAKRKRPQQPNAKFVRTKTKPKLGSVERPEAKGARASNTWSDQLMEMLSRPKGATAAEVAAAFNWLEHTARARISMTPRSYNPDQPMRAVRERELRPDKSGKHTMMVSVYRVATELPLGLKHKELGVLYVKPERERTPKAKAA